MSTIILRDAGSITAPGAIVKNLPLNNHEVDNNFSNLSIAIGIITDLETEANSNIVASINSLNSSVSNVTTFNSRLSNVEADIGNVDNLLLSSSNLTEAVNVITLSSGIIDGNVNGKVFTNSTWNGNIIAVNRGGTGANTATNARINLGLVIGTHVQPWNANLDALVNIGGTTVNPKVIVNQSNIFNGLDSASFKSVFGFGTVSSQNSNNINISGGSIGGTTSINVTANIAATTFIGDGSKLTGINGGGSGSGSFNEKISNVAVLSVPYGTSSNLFAAPLTVNTRYIVHSIHITNLSPEEVGVSTSFNGSVGYPESISCGLQIPVPVGSSVEILKRPKILQPGNYIRMVAHSDQPVQAVATIEEVNNNILYFGQGIDVTLSSSYTDLWVSGANTIIESILLANDSDTDNVKARVAWFDTSNVLVGYYCYDLIVPVKSTIEILDKPKFLPMLNRIKVYANVGNRLEAMIAGKRII